jgi:diaminopimelate decarboxylase
VLPLFQKAKTSPHFDIVGVACHIGSQITSLTPFQAAFARVFSLIAQLEEQGIALSHVNLGGGLGVAYQNEIVPSQEDYVQSILKACPSHLKIVIEPGRAIVAKAGILVTQVLYLKTMTHKNFCIVDAAMNDFIRPSLYSAKQNIMPVLKRDIPSLEYDVVGPVCESGDCFGKERPLAVLPGDLLALREAGAYGYVMSSNYNTRPRIAEMMVKDHVFKTIKLKETVDDLLRGEILW